MISLYNITSFTMVIDVMRLPPSWCRKFRHQIFKLNIGKLKSIANIHLPSLHPYIHQNSQFFNSHFTIYLYFCRVVRSEAQAGGDGRQDMISHFRTVEELTKNSQLTMTHEIKVFISSVQCEFAKERRQLCNYIRNDSLLGRFLSLSSLKTCPLPKCRRKKHTSHRPPNATSI